MNVDGVLHGDPLEASALQGIQWAWNATTHTAYPLRDVNNSSSSLQKSTRDSTPESAGKDKREDMDRVRSKSRRRGLFATGSVQASPLGSGEGSGVATSEAGGAAGDGLSVGVWRRHSFSSQLQRMSVIAEVDGRGLTAKEGSSEVRISNHRVLACHDYEVS